MIIGKVMPMLGLLHDFDVDYPMDSVSAVAGEVILYCETIPPDVNHS